jgi:DNA-binding LacI/PurR family transcriptional regulator
MSITLREVAAKLNLSRGLVSRVLNNDSGVRVSKQTRERIHVSAQEMQYRPSPSARALSTGRSRQIAISGADEGLHNYLSSRLLEQQGLIEAVARQDYRVVLLPSTSDRPESREFEEALYTSGCDGVCLYAAQGSPELYAALRQLAVPFVVLGNPGDLSLPQVDHDNYRYAYDAVAWLREQGHTRIGFTDFVPAAVQPFAFDLHQGYQDAMNALGAGFDPAHVLGAQAGSAERLAFVQTPHAPTALIVRDWRGANDWRVVMQTHGIRVPQDITILAQVSISEWEYLDPGFAYQAHDPRALGLRAGEMLLNRIETGLPTESEVIRLPVMPPKWRPDWFFG